MKTNTQNIRTKDEKSIILRSIEQNILKETQRGHLVHLTPQNVDNKMVNTLFPFGFQKASKAEISQLLQAAWRTSVFNHPHDKRNSMIKTWNSTVLGQTPKEFHMCTGILSVHNAFHSPHSLFIKTRMSQFGYKDAVEY